MSQVRDRVKDIELELLAARQAVLDVTSVERYDAAKRKVAYLQGLLERYKPSAKPDPFTW